MLKGAKSYSGERRASASIRKFRDGHHDASDDMPILARAKKRKDGCASSSNGSQDYTFSPCHARLERHAAISCAI